MVALIVIGPEKLPRVARTLGSLLGKAQRYISDVKAEVNRSMDLDELKKMKESMEGAAKTLKALCNQLPSISKSNGMKPLPASPPSPITRPGCRRRRFTSTLAKSFV